MPGRIFGIIDLRRSAPTSPQLEAAHLNTKNGPVINNNNTSTSSHNNPNNINTSTSSTHNNINNINSILESQRRNMDHFKRPAVLTLGKRHSSSDKKDRSISKDNKKTPTRSSNLSRPVRLDMFMESPPVVFNDLPQQSTGALISGRLKVVPVDRNVVLNSIVMYLEATTTVKKPIQDRCRECMHMVSDLYEWNFWTKPKAFPLAQGAQEVPFSHLIPGHLPATTHGHLASIEYSLHVRAKSSDGAETEFRHDLPISRALRHGTEKNSIRIFPPTNLNLNVTLPSIVYVNGEFQVTCRMTGIVTKKDDTHTWWRLRKLTWRIEENEEMVSPACKQHAAKVGGEGNGIKHKHTREVGTEELKRGWKTSIEDDQIEGEFSVSMDASKHPQCDVDSQNGLKISHILVLEMVIAEEWAPSKRPQQFASTGAARVLRTQFNLNVSSRAGMGIAWDDEMPPMYEDVPDSPPRYFGDDSLMVDAHGEDVLGQIEPLTLNNPPHGQPSIDDVSGIE